MEKFILDNLSSVLGEELASDLLEYVMTIDSSADFEEYMKGLLDFSNKEQKQLFEKINAAKFGNRFKNNTKNNSSGINSGASTSKLVTQAVEPTDNGAKKKQIQKKKTKKYNLNELQQGLLKEGRIPCDCQASQHKLINNCLECGRIVCEQEGSGPCFFCDNMVCTPEEEEILNSSTKQADALYRTLNDRKKSEVWKKAIENRNRLIDYDRNNTSFTKVTDDDHDYYAAKTDKWSSKKQREKAAKRAEEEQEHKYGSRLGPRKILLDLLDQKAYEDNTYTPQDFEEEEEIVTQSSNEPSRKVDLNIIFERLRATPALKPITKNSKTVNQNSEESETTLNNYIIQDKEFLEMQDKGMCLSMHQPWASLLIAGIKKHEGRSWYTAHRGTLWIASTVKAPEPETIKEIETFYKKYYEGKAITFPKTYPTGVLLGYVLLQECLDQNEYRETFPNGESESPYVFICSDPNRLSVPCRVRGQHKIWKLDPNDHMKAKDSFIKVRKFDNFT